MGKKKEVRRVVLDTNILVSALIFHGELSRIVECWKSGTIVPIISKETFEEFQAVLSYPKFKLTTGEIKNIIEDEVLPFFEVIENTAEVRDVCKDPDDDKFIACALSAKADFIVSGDKVLCDVGKYKSVHIINAREFLKSFL